VWAAKDSEVYTGDNTADIDNISCERKKKKKKKTSHLMIMIILF
jgi:hypothetical protein